MSVFVRVSSAVLRRVPFVTATVLIALARSSFAQPPPEHEAPPGAAAQLPYPGPAYPTTPGPPVMPAYPPYPPYPPYQPYPVYPPYPAGTAQPLPPPYGVGPNMPQPVAPQSAVATSANPDGTGFSFGATLGSTVVREDESTTVLFSPLLEGTLALHRMAHLRATWGLAWAVDGQGLGESTGRAGNPMLSGVFRTGKGPWRLTAELGVTAPAAHVPLTTDGRSYAFTYNQTMALWGMWYQWLWTPDRMAVPIQVSFGYALGDEHWLVVEVADAALIGVRGRASGSNFVGQVALEARFWVEPKLTLCPRWQTVRLPSGGVDVWQSALGLRMALATGAGRFFAGFLVNLDEPVGILGGMGRWGFHLGKEIDL